MARPMGRHAAKADEVIDLRDDEVRDDRDLRDEEVRDLRDPAGRDAEKPSDVPARGWVAIFKRVKAEIKNDHLSLLAAGVAFKALLSLFPTVIAAVTIWGLIASPQEITRQISSFASALPEEASTLLTDQMTQVASGSAGALSLALVGSLLLALWSASGGMAGLIEGCNAAYNEVDNRSFPKKRGLALVLTLGGIVFLVLAIGLIAVLPPLMGAVGLEETTQSVISIAKWPLLALLVMGALALVYKVAPDRDQPKMRWVSWGAAIATVLWLIGSAGFTLYVNNFGSFGATYGTFAGIIILMLWMYLTSFIVLLGAEINAELERQTARDSTRGHPEPLGERGAVAADTTPEDYETPRR